MLGASVSLVALLLAVAASASVCDLTGDWVVNTRLDTGGSVPGSNVSVVSITQQPDGSFTAVTVNQSQGKVWTGTIDTNRHLKAELSDALSVHQGVNCTTEASCKTTCLGMSTCPAHLLNPEVYYCCGACNGAYACPTNVGLLDCACNAPPPAPLTQMAGTIQPACSVVLWECGEPISGSCEGRNPRETWHRVDAETETVHVVYFSHFDAGYTHDTSLEVLQEYFDKWYPQAYNTSKQLRARAEGETFKWTTHPWLIQQLFNNATGLVKQAQIDDMVDAINRGDITWHAAPMNLQAETADPSLYSFGLSISARLDRQFHKPGKTSISQKDVPGSTIGMVPLAAAAGVKSFHVGANDFSTVPAAPFRTPEMYDPCHTFRWKVTNSSDDELLCFFCSGYSQGFGPHAGMIPEMIVSLTPFGGVDTLAYLMTTDNSGPQSAEEVLQGWRSLRAMFPNAKIVDSSLEAFTERAWAVRGAMPMVTDELGDTWIRGTGADPTKARRYRVVARQLAAAIASGAVMVDDPRVVASYDELIKLPEHTYGSNDGLVADLPWDNAYLDSHLNDSAFQRTAAGYLDQRAYIDRAVAALDGLAVQNTILTELAASSPSPLNTDGLDDWPLDAMGAPIGGVQCGAVQLGFNNAGAIDNLVDSQGRQWAGINNTIGRFRYASHSEWEFDSYGERYMLPGCRNDSSANLCGFGKAGLSSKAGAVSKDWRPSVTKAWRNIAGTKCRLVVAITFPLQAQNMYGAPSVANITVSAAAGGLELDVQYHKRHTRMAESLWFSFAPRVSDVRGWRLNKLGVDIDPFAVVVNGSRAMHALWGGINYYEPALVAGHSIASTKEQPALAIQSLDAPLIAVDTPSPIVFLRDEQIQGKSWHFNFFNNAWNTNYPLWEINADERFRFVLTF